MLFTPKESVASFKWLNTKKNIFFYETGHVAVAADDP